MGESTSEWTHRPWGRYFLVHTAPGLWVKTIVVEPWSQLSLQSHEFRRETWHVAEAGMKAIIGDETIDLSPNQAYTVDYGVKHRLINPSRYEMVVTEVATGEPDESDIIRYEDEYGRV